MNISASVPHIEKLSNQKLKIIESLKGFFDRENRLNFDLNANAMNERDAGVQFNLKRVYKIFLLIKMLLLWYAYQIIKLQKRSTTDIQLQLQPTHLNINTHIVLSFFHFHFYFDYFVNRIVHSSVLCNG